MVVGGGGGGPQSDYSVCPRPLRRVFDFSGFWFSGVQVFGFSGFQVEYTWVHLGILWLVSVCILYFGFLVSLVFGFLV